MKFTVSSSALLSLLATTGKVISSKNTLPILDYFHLDLKNGELKVMASDTETTVIGTIAVDVESEGMIAAPAKLLLDSLKEFPELPLVIEVNDRTWEIKLSWKSGSLSIPGVSPISFPPVPVINPETRYEVTFKVDTLVNGINKTIFATADDELRPIMNGVYFDLAPEGVTFVATDAYKLVKYTTDAASTVKAAFILPKKPANLLKTALLKEENDIEVCFDNKNAMFKLKNHTIVSRLIEGNYPNYNSVIPTNNSNRLLIDRIELVNGIRRVAVCSNPTTNLIRMEIADNKVNLTAQDIDFSVSANESLNCSYEGSPVVIGFKSTFLVDVLSNIDTPTVEIQLADATRAGLFVPVYDEPQTSKALMLLMPMMLNS